MASKGTKLVLIDSLYRQYDLGRRHVEGAIFRPMVKNPTDNKVYRAFRKVHLSSPLPFKSAWLGGWEDDLEVADTVILADGGNSENVARYIHGLSPDMRIILWYRNSVEASGEPSPDIAGSCEIWSFDKADCERYGYRYNPQFYGGNPAYKERDPEWDVFFVGQEKGRLQKIRDIEARLKGVGLTTEFRIVGHNSGYLPYDKVVDLISRSRAILDIQADWQDGMTLRPLEALFYKKKLITNSSAYASSDLYDSSNAFLVDKDDWLCISDFVRGLYKVQTNRVSLLRKYGIEGWLERFEIKNQAKGCRQ